MATTLLDLPAELIVNILESAPDSHGLFALILTAPAFALVWKPHAFTISHTVLRRSVECYSSARQLDLTSTLIFPTLFEQTVQRHKRILATASCVDAFYELFLDDYITEKPGLAQVGLSKSCWSLHRVFIGFIRKVYLRDTV